MIRLHIHAFILILFCCFSCTQNRVAQPLLVGFEQQIENCPDSILNLLESLDRATLVDKYNKAYYDILLAEARSKSSIPILALDSALGEAIDYLDNSRDKRLLAKALLYKGDIWFEELNEPQEALKHYYTALEYADEINDHHTSSMVHNNLGNLYIHQDLCDEALEAFKRSYFYKDKTNIQRNRIVGLRNIGFGYLFVNNLDSAVHYFDKALNLAGSSVDSITYNNMIHNDYAIYYGEIGEYAKALEHLAKITVMNDKTNLNKGSILLSLGQLDSAYYYLSQTKQSNDLIVQTSSYHYLYKLETQLGHLDKAIHYQDEYIQRYDSIISQTHTSEIHAINHKHNLDKAIGKLEHEHSIRVLFLATFFIIFILLLSFIYVVHDRKKKIKQKNQEKAILQKENQILEKEIEISGLVQQIEKTRNTILRLKYENENITNLQQDLQQKEQELLEIQNKVDALRHKLITDKPLFSKILKLAQQKESDSVKVLSPHDREELKGILKFVYADFIEDLQASCPSLTDEDVLFCCLSKLNLSLFAISICTGYDQTGSVRQRKHRIKKKMTEDTDNSTLYDSIFSS